MFSLQVSNENVLAQNPFKRVKKETRPQGKQQTVSVFLAGHFVLLESRDVKITGFTVNFSAISVIVSHFNYHLIMVYYRALK